ncbi:MAG: RNA pseudouridine synthase [Gemmatimonadaceae bacterium]|nr:RNA pseudouridine synthase [Acetobacteraceae bacterium]
MIPILFSDQHYVVLDKPAGLPVHAGPGGGPSVEDAFPSLSRRRDGPWLVHRLDADTSGCLVVALRKQPLLAAQAAFAAGSVRKTYWAIVHGVPAAASGEVEDRLAKITTKAGWRMQSGVDGVPARTAWRRMGQAGGLAWLELHPRTGRTHQVRVHCAVLGHPIVGDPVYGAGDGPLQLLARAIEVPVDPPLTATAPPPAHMRAALIACGWPGH